MCVMLQNVGVHASSPMIVIAVTLMLKQHGWDLDMAGRLQMVLLQNEPLLIPRSFLESSYDMQAAVAQGLQLQVCAST